MHEKLASLPWRELSIVCLGTDRSTGDSFGPLVGSRLSELLDIPVFGTLENPVHALNLQQTIERIETPYVLAIDAALGKSEHVGEVHFYNGPLRPGSGVKKKLPEVGNWHITGVVNVAGFMEYFVLQSTRLSLVMGLVEDTVGHIMEAIGTYEGSLVAVAAHE